MDWGDIQKKLRDAAQKIRENKYFDPTVESLLEEIPVVGNLASKYWSVSKSNDAEKAEQFAQLLDYAAQGEEQLSQLLDYATREEEQLLQLLDYAAQGEKQLSQLLEYAAQGEKQLSQLLEYAAQGKEQFKAIDKKLSILINQQPSATPSLIPRQAKIRCEHFVDRLEKSEPIKDRLLSYDASQKGLPVTAIQGLPACGKTELARSLANDEKVEDRFSDGTLWATLGQNPDKSDLLKLLLDWVQGFGDYKFKTTSIKSASDHLQSLLHDKAVLLVVDDVWNVEDVEPFLVGGASCHVLITTRRAYVADDVDAKLYKLGEMTPDQSLELFSNKLDRVLEGKEREEALLVAESVGYLALALESAVARINRGTTWIKLYEALNEEIARLEVLEKPRRRQKGELGLEASINLSLKALKSYDEEAWQAFVWLGVLPEDAEITELMATTLWNLDEKDDAEGLLELLWDEALLIRDSQIQFGEQTLWAFRVHDVMHDIACHLLTGPTTPEREGDLPGFGLSLSEAHVHILGRYQTKLENGKWSSLQDDGYIHYNLTWHMEKAGWIEEIHALLREETSMGRNAWNDTRESLGQTAGFIKDVARAWQLTEDASKSKIEKGENAPTVGLETRYALITASVNSLSSNIPPDLLVGLVETGIYTSNQGLAYARQVPEAKQRVEALTKIAPKLPEPQRDEVMKEALEAAKKIRDETSWANALSAIVPKLPESQRDEVMKEALHVARQQIPYKASQARALVRIASGLPESQRDEVMKEALESVTQIKGEYSRGNVLADIVPKLPESMMKEALELATKIRYEDARILALDAIAPRIPESMMKEAQEIARQILDGHYENEYYQALTLAKIVPKLPESQREEMRKVALEMARYIQGEHCENKYFQANALAEIVPTLPKSQKDKVIKEALETARQIQNKFDKAVTLAEIVPTLPKSQKDKVGKEALEAAGQIQKELDHANALAAIVSKLPESQREEVIKETLDVARRLQNRYDLTGVLAKIAPKLPESMMKEVLEITTKIPDEYYRARALAAIAPKLPESQREKVRKEALETARQIQDEYDRAKELAAIAPKLPESQREEVRKEALETATKIQDEYRKAMALAAIAPKLPESQREEVRKEALEAATKIQDEYWKAMALAAIAPKLPESMMKETLEIIKKMDGLYQKEVLAAIAPKLPESMMKETLEIIKKIPDGLYKAKVLAAIAPKLPESQREEVRKEVLEAARQNHLIFHFDVKVSWGRILTEIVPKLPESMRKEALEIIKKIPDEYDKAWALVGIAPKLPETQREEVRKEALETATKIQDKGSRAKALAAIAPKLPESQREEVRKEALEIAMQIQDELYRAEVLAAIVTHHVSIFSLDLLYPIWMEILHGYASSTRENLFRHLGTLTPLIYKLGEEKALNETFYAIKDVARWWP